MGSPISPIVANLYMEDFEMKAINSSPYPLVFGEDLLMITLPSQSHHIKDVSGPHQFCRKSHPVYQ